MNKNSLVIMDKKTKEKRVETYGTCVWATGIAPVPLTKEIARKIPGQTNRLLVMAISSYELKCSFVNVLDLLILRCMIFFQEWFNNG